MIWFMLHYGNGHVSMMIADGLAPIWRQGINNHHADVS